MKKIHSIYFGKRFLTAVLLIGGLFASCSKETPAGTEPGRETPIRIQTRAPESFDFEEKINRVRLVVFGGVRSQDDGDLLLNRYFASVADGETLTAIVTSGYRDIYVIANEPLDDSSQPLPAFTGIATPDDIRAISLGYAGSSHTTVDKKPWRPADIPMFITYTDHEIKADGSTVVGGQIERAMVKATLNISYKLSDLSGDEVVFESIAIQNLPSTWPLVRPTLHSYGYAGTLIDSEVQAVSGTKTGSGVNETFTATNVFYLPEYILSDPDDDTRYPYFEINARLKNNASATFKYTARLGDAQEQAVTGSDRWDLTRNRHYAFNGKVVNYGDLNLGLEIKAVVLPWNKNIIDIDDGVNAKITKDVIDFTPAGGRAVFEMALNRNDVPWKIYVENANEFELYGLTETQPGAGEYVKGCRVIPRRFNTGTVTSTHVIFEVNGRKVDEATVTADGTWKFSWSPLTIDLQGGNTLRIMDRNIGASSPLEAGAFFRHGQRTGFSSDFPLPLVPVSSGDRIACWGIASWKNHAYTVYPISNAGDETVIAESICPEGWRLPTQTEAEQLITYMTPYGPFDGTAASGYSLPAMESGQTVFFPAAGRREEGSLARVQSGAAGYYMVSAYGNVWLQNDSTNEVRTAGSPNWATSVRCVADN